MAFLGYMGLLNAPLPPPPVMGVRRWTFEFSRGELTTLDFMMDVD